MWHQKFTEIIHLLCPFCVHMIDNLRVWDPVNTVLNSACHCRQYFGKETLHSDNMWHCNWNELMLIVNTLWFISEQNMLMHKHIHADRMISGITSWSYELYTDMWKSTELFKINFHSVEPFAMLFHGNYWCQFININTEIIHIRRGMAGKLLNCCIFQVQVIFSWDMMNDRE